MQIEITGRTEQIIREQIELGGYNSAEEVVAEALKRFSSMGKTAPLPAERKLSTEEFRKILERMAEIGKNVPVLPDAALTRESIYGDER